MSPTWTLHEGDCIAGMATLEDGSVDHVITDPPYEAEAHTLQRRVKRGAGSLTLSVEPLDFAPMDEAGRIGGGREFARLARRWALVFCQVEAAMLWRDALVAGGHGYRRTCVWVKPDGQPQLSGDRPGMGYESIVATHTPGRSAWNGGGTCGVWAINKNEQTAHEHPTQKPVALMEKLVKLFTDPGDTILDPFAGSGTTGVAAIRLGRNFIGWEKDPKYAEIARKRLGAAREQLTLPRANRLTAKQEPLL